MSHYAYAKPDDDLDDSNFKPNRLGWFRGKKKKADKKDAAGNAQADQTKTQPSSLPETVITVPDKQESTDTATTGEIPDMKNGELDVLLDDSLTKNNIPASGTETQMAAVAQAQPVNMANASVAEQNPTSSANKDTNTESTPPATGQTQTPQEAKQNQAQGWEQVMAEFKALPQHKNVTTYYLEQWARLQLKNGWQCGQPVPDLESFRAEFGPEKTYGGQPVPTLYVYWYGGNRGRVRHELLDKDKHNYNGFWVYVDSITGYQSELQQNDSVAKYYEAEPVSAADLQNLFAYARQNNIKLNHTLQQVAANGTGSEAMRETVEQIQRHLYKKAPATGYGLYTTQLRKQIAGSLGANALQESLYKIKNGDTPQLIAQKTNIDLELLLQYNNLEEKTGKDGHKQIINSITGEPAQFAEGGYLELPPKLSLPTEEQLEEFEKKQAQKPEVLRQAEKASMRFIKPGLNDKEQKQSSKLNRNTDLYAKVNTLNTTSQLIGPAPDRVIEETLRKKNSGEKNYLDTETMVLNAVLALEQAGYAPIKTLNDYHKAMNAYGAEALEFLQTFEVKAYQTSLAMIHANRQTLLAEAQKYGVFGESQPNTETLTTCARKLQNAIHFKKTKESQAITQQSAMLHDYSSDPQAKKEMQESIARLNMEGQAHLKSVQAQIYPLCPLLADENLSIAIIAGNTSPDKIIDELKRVILMRLEYLQESETEIKGLSDNKAFIWKVPEIVEETKKNLDIAPQSVTDQMIGNKIEHVQDQEFNRNLFLAGLALGLGVISGGAGFIGMLGMLGSVGLSAYFAQQSQNQYDLEVSLNKGSLDGYGKTLMREQPDAFWLYVDLIALGLDVGFAFKIVESVGKSARAFKLAAKGDIEATKGALLDEVHDLAKLEKSNEEAVKIREALDEKISNRPHPSEAEAKPAHAAEAETHAFETAEHLDEEVKELLSESWRTDTDKIISSGKKAEQFLNKHNANAMYLPGEAGKPGILILRESASPKVIMEELLHFEQHRLLGFKKLSAAEMLQMENEAHEALLYYGKSKGWSKADLAKLEENQQYWKNKTEEFAKNPEAVEKELKGLKNTDENGNFEKSSLDSKKEVSGKPNANSASEINRIDNLGLTNLRTKINSLDESNKTKFLNEFENASDDTLRALNTEPNLVNAWQKVTYLTQEAKDVEFLRALEKVEADDVWRHIEGEVYSPTSAAGGHTLTNHTKTSIGVEDWIVSDKIRFKVSDIQLPNPWHDGMEIQKARRIQIFDGTNWVDKGMGGKSSFFPSSWSKQQVLEETALAFKNAKENSSSFKGGNVYEVLASDGITKIRFFYGNQTDVNPLFNGTTNPVIRSSFPIN